ncbi:MAG: ABC transporter substrate-binding protein [Deltaproteobacteria bacterium]|nr:ABC transporter substrate-binding protein [Deltaproteobacteria bacterium]
MSPTSPLLAALITTGLSVALGAGCAAEEPLAGKTLAIGVVIDRTGNNSEPSWVDAIKLARRHANLGLRQAAYRDLQFELLIADSGNEPTVALPRAVDLVRNKGARALILDTSQNDLAVNKTYYDADPTNDLDVPLQCGSCTPGSMNNPAATDADPIAQLALRNDKGWNFRSVMSTKAISEVLVSLMLEDGGGDANGDGAFKVAFYGSDEAFGRGAAKDLKAFLTQLHPSPPPLFEEVYHPRDADPSSYTWAEDLRVLADNLNQTTGAVDGYPDFVAVADFAQQQAAVIKAWRQGGFRPRMLHYHSMRFSTVLETLGALSEGAEGVSHVLFDSGPSGEEFASEYAAVYGESPRYRDSNYYDAAMTFMLAAVIAGVGLDDPLEVTGREIRDALAHTSAPGGEVIGTGPEEFARALALIEQGRPIDYQGASGPMDYDARGNVTGRLARFRAQGGAFVDIARFDCVTDPSCPQLLP